MTERLRIAVTALTLNEIDGVRALLPHISDCASLDVDEVFAVDGGSTDGTLDAYERYGVRVVAQRSRGRGEAMRLAARSTDVDAIIFFSPDGNEDWRDIPRFRPHLERGADLVIASRMMAGAVNEEDQQLLRLRKWANNAFNLGANLAFRHEGPFITDSINGFRGVKRHLLEALDLDAVGYTVEYQMTMRALARRLNVVEFPTVEGQRIGGETKAAAIPTGLRFVRCFADELLRAARARR